MERFMSLLCGTSSASPILCILRIHHLFHPLYLVLAQTFLVLTVKIFFAAFTFRDSGESLISFSCSKAKVVFIVVVLGLSAHLLFLSIVW